MKKKYSLRAMITVSAWTEVEADSKEEALQIARDRHVADIPAYVLYPSDKESWHFDNDGEPQNIEIEEIGR